MPQLHLSVDQVLSTTRAVRRRLDLTRHVERNVVEECIALAQQAPTSANMENLHFVVVSEPDQRLALAELHPRAFRSMLPDFAQGPARYGTRGWQSVHYLYKHLHEVPLLLVPCHLTNGQRESIPPVRWSMLYANAHMATWSFMLAARERGIGTCMLMGYLFHEQAAADILGVDYQQVVQTALIPVAYTIGTDFRPVARKPVAEILHWDRW
jgi:nitroreductase